MSVLDAMSQPSFPNSAAFAAALSAGVAADVAAALQPLQAQINALSSKIDSLESQPPPPPDGGTDTNTAPRDKLIGVSVEPLEVVAFIGPIIGAGLYRTGDQATLRVETLSTEYDLDGWYNAAGERVATSFAYTFTVTESENFVLKFIKKGTTSIVPISISWTKAYVGGETNAALRISGNGQTTAQAVPSGEGISALFPQGTSVTISIGVVQAGARYTWISNGTTVSSESSFTTTLNQAVSYNCVVDTL